MVTNQSQVPRKSSPLFFAFSKSSLSLWWPPIVPTKWRIKSHDVLRARSSMFKNLVWKSTLMSKRKYSKIFRKAQNRIKNVVEFLLSPFSIIFNMSNVSLLWKAKRKLHFLRIAFRYFSHFLVSGRLRDDYQLLRWVAFYGFGKCENVMPLLFGRSLMDPFMD